MKKVGMPALFVLQMMVMAGLVSILFLVRQQWAPARIIGAGMITVSAALLLTARYQLGRSFAVTAQARVLVTRGIYSRIRNPVYVFGAFLVLGVCMFFGKPYFLLILLLVIPLQIWRAHREARVLEAKFGDAYREYRKQTWF